MLFEQNSSRVLKLFLNLFINYILLFFQSSISDVNDIVKSVEDLSLQSLTEQNAAV